MKKEKNTKKNVAVTVVVAIVCLAVGAIGGGLWSYHTYATTATGKLWRDAYDNLYRQREVSLEIEDQTISSPSSKSGIKAEKQAEPSSEGDIDSYHVKILDCKYGALDYEGKKTIAVTFEFTNNSDEAQAFSDAVYPVAYQDGVQLPDTSPKADSAAYDRTMTMVKTGKKVTCEYYWQTTSDTADVDVEVSSYLDESSAKLQKTFSIK